MTPYAHQNKYRDAKRYRGEVAAKQTAYNSAVRAREKAGTVANRNYQKYYYGSLKGISERHISNGREWLKKKLTKMANRL